MKEAKVKARKEAAKTSESDKDRALDEQDILKVLLHASVRLHHTPVLQVCVVLRSSLYEVSFWQSVYQQVMIM